MTISIRSALTGLALLLCAMLCVASPASALVTKVGSTTVGLQPRVDALEEELGNTSSFGNESGNAILSGTSVYAVYWDPQDVFHQHHEWMTKISTFFEHMGAASGAQTNILAALGQYRDRSNAQARYSTVFKGAYTDFTKYPEAAGCTDPAPLAVGAITCLTDAQLRAQLQSFISEHGLPTGMNTIYYVLTPPGVTVCLDSASTHCSDFSVTSKELEEGKHKSTSYQDSFCSYHGDINPDNAVEGDASTIIYAAIPWTAGTLGDVHQISKGQLSGEYDYANAYECQDGGLNPENHEENYEKATAPDEDEQKILNGEKGTPKEKEQLEEKRRLEGPHIEEPNQEGLDEARDYSAGLADLIINQVAEEQADTVTDPLLNSWKNIEGDEVTDLCRNVFASTVGPEGGAIGGSVLADLLTEAGTLFNTVIDGGNYYVNNVYSLSGDDCVGGVGGVARFTPPNPVNPGELVGFDGMESTVGLLEGEVFGPTGPPSKTYATFSWNFGDGTTATGYAPGSSPCEAPWISPCAGSVFHTYQYGGKYKVKLTITDVAGNSYEVEHEVVVSGPTAAEVAAASAAAAAAAAAAAQPAPAPPATPAIVSPIASASVLSHSLRNATRKGLVVGYSVNEQVAGHFEVLLSKSLASKLKIGGSPAVGLPAGTPPETTIAKAILITTKGGHGTIEIRFSKSVAAKLAHARKVPLMVRLIVRSAASKSAAATTTVVSTVTLSV